MKPRKTAYLKWKDILMFPNKKYKEKKL